MRDNPDSERREKCMFDSVMKQRFYIVVRGSALVLDGKKRGQKKRGKRLISFPTRGGSLRGNYFSHSSTRKRQERGLLSWELSFLGRSCFWDPVFPILFFQGILFLESPVFGSSCFGGVISGELASFSEKRRG
jgi:hypothetical protein